MKAEVHRNIQAALAATIGVFWRRPSCLHIVTYHGVQAGKDARRYVAPDSFRAQLEHLAEQGYRTLRVRDIVADWPTIPSAERRVALTFDDGLACHRDVVCPLLSQYGMTASFFVATGCVGHTRARGQLAGLGGYRDAEIMSWADLRDMMAEGFEIGAHTHNHMPLGDLGPTAARSEVITCKLRLEDALGKEVRSFAYPKGRKSSFAPWTREILAKAGYRAACTTVEGAVVPSSDPMLLPRIDVNGSDGRAQFAWKIEGQYDFLRWIRRWR